MREKAALLAQQVPPGRLHHHLLELALTGEGNSMVKLYCQHPGGDRYLGAYRDQKAAEAFWHLMFKRLQELHGKDIQPVYVKTGKGSGK